MFLANGLKLRDRGCTLALMLAIICVCAPALAANASDQACRSIAKLKIPSVIFTEASLQKPQEIPADPFTAFTGASPQAVKVGGHCLVRGVIGKRQGVDGQSYGTRFEVRLPTTWNDMFLFQGGGAVDGFLAPAVGTIPCRNSTAAPGLLRGYAVVSMDGGHPSPDPAFGVDQAARIDFAYASIGKVTSVSKQVIAKFYGAAPKKSVFMGCSNGGREALIAAQRYPLEFDGIVAGSPGFRLSAANIAEAWDTRQYMSIAPKDEADHPILSRAFSQQDLNIVAKAVLAACDARDGIEDGVINAWQQCRFDPKVLSCQGDKTDSCLTAGQVQAMSRAFAGPESSDGEKLYSDWPYDTGVAGADWRMWKLGNSPTSQSDANNIVLGARSLQYYFMTPPAPNFDPLKFDFDKDPARVADTAKLNDATGTYLASFGAHGGKLLLFQGLSDPVFSANDLVRWYKQVVEVTSGGDLEATRRFVRMFIIPGMTHCGDGQAFDDFDPLAAIEGWINQDKAPDSLAAGSKAFPGKHQPICAYPTQAAYGGKGNPDEIASYSCRG
ncbi:tannase/feruloyl esterase family alpha/beta hydrolase [Mesorhizobium sp. M0204]|uniref:tannase/feruloyl esterase family alpha/beta hydrolase n=1 Tax=Mesorhizobium sp. M0204 TaxID=2956913 RepID=UPI00333506AD